MIQLTHTILSLAFITNPSSLHILILTPEVGLGIKPEASLTCAALVQDIIQSRTANVEARPAHKVLLQQIGAIRGTHNSLYQLNPNVWTTSFPPLPHT